MKRGRTSERRMADTQDRLAELEKRLKGDAPIAAILQYRRLFHEPEEALWLIVIPKPKSSRHLVPHLILSMPSSKS